MYDLVLKSTNSGNSFDVQHRNLTRSSNPVIWPKQVQRHGLSIFECTTLVLKSGLGYAEAQREKDRFEKAWGKSASGLNYISLP